jgi:hypothetical protein
MVWTSSCSSPAAGPAAGISAEQFSASVQQMLLQGHVWAPCYKLPPGWAVHLPPTQQQMRPTLAATAWKLLQLLPSAAASAPVRANMRPVWYQGAFLTPHMAQLVNTYGEQQQQQQQQIA